MVNFLFSWSPTQPTDILTEIAPSDMSIVTYLLAFFLTKYTFYPFYLWRYAPKNRAKSHRKYAFLYLDAEHCEKQI